MAGFNFDPLAHFQIGDGAVTLTKLGQEFAGNVENDAYSRGELLAGMTIRIMKAIDQPSPSANDAEKSAWLYGTVMTGAADTAQPPLSTEDRELFMAGARKVLIGGNA